MEAETIENIWHHTKCIDLLAGQKIIEIDSESSVTEGCEVKRVFINNNNPLLIINCVLDFG